MKRTGSKVDRLLMTVLGLYLISVVVRLSPPTHAQLAETRPVSYLPVIFSPPPTPAPGRPLINEVMYNHILAGDDGEWIALYNAGDFTVDLSGYKLGDEEIQDGHEGMYAFPDGNTLGPRQVIIIASKAAIFHTLYGFLPAFELTDTDLTVPELADYPDWSDGNLGLANDGDEVILLDEVDQLADAVVWGNGLPFFYPTVQRVAPGHTIERYPPFQDSDTALDWRDQPAPSPGSVDTTPPTRTPTLTSTSTPTRTSTNTSTPTSTSTPTRTPTPTPTPTDTPTPTSASALVINEILADPGIYNGDANGDLTISPLDDEFIEIVNASGETVDLSGWRLEDRFYLRHIFEDGTLLADGCAVIVFGGGNPTGGFGGSLVQTASTGHLWLNNDEERVTLLDPDQTPVAAVSYGLEADDDQSLARNPDITGPEPLVPHASLPAANGRRFSPGTRLDGTPFAICNP